jgi:hypothetical protein
LYNPYAKPEITVVLQRNSICSGEHFDEVTRNVVQETVMKIYLRQRLLKLLQWQAVQQLKKLENRKLEDVLIVINYLAACKNYVLSHYLNYHITKI